MPDRSRPRRRSAASDGDARENFVSALIGASALTRPLLVAIEAQLGGVPNASGDEWNWDCFLKHNLSNNVRNFRK